jgi:hypothetical protein
MKLKDIGNFLIAAYVKKIEKRDKFLWAHVEVSAILFSLIPKKLVHPDYYIKVKDKNYIIFMTKTSHEDPFVLYRPRKGWLREWKELNVNGLPPRWRDSLIDGQDPKEAVKIVKRILNLKAFL